MSYELLDLVVDRVDLVDEGANSAAFIELYKRKEISKPMDFEEILSKMKPEHAAVIKQTIADKEADLAKARGEVDTATQSLATKSTELDTANEALAKANTELETLKAKDDTCTCDGEADENGMCKACGKPKKKSASFDETETMKGMPEAVRAMFAKERAKREAAEEQVRKAAEAKAEAEAIAKASTLKALPIEQERLVGILKNCNQEVLELLTAANTAIEATVLGEVGKNKGNGADTSAEDAWNKLEKRAKEIAARDSITKEKAMSKVISENPDLYCEYLNGGAK